MTTQGLRIGTCALAALVGLSAPAGAAPQRPRLVKGSYVVSLARDVTHVAMAVARETPLGPAPCTSVEPKSTDRRDLTIPAAGRLKVNLTGPAGQVDDWDLFLLSESGEVLAASNSNATILLGSGAKEAVQVDLRKMQTVTVVVCNALGEHPESKGTVDYLFTHRS